MFKAGMIQWFAESLAQFSNGMSGQIGGGDSPQIGGGDSSAVGWLRYGHRMPKKYMDPICSMYGIFTNICPKKHPNVGFYIPYIEHMEM